MHLLIFLIWKSTAKFELIGIFSITLHGNIVRSQHVLVVKVYWNKFYEGNAYYFAELIVTINLIKAEITCNNSDPKWSKMIEHSL